MKNNNYYKLIINRILDQVGNVTYDYSNSVWLASMGTLGQKYLGVYQISENIISIVFNPVAGAVADNTSRKKILLLTESISALICILISLIANEQILVYGIILANIVLALTYAFFSTAFKAMIPNVIATDKILSFNSTVETIAQTLSVASPLFTYYVYAIWGIRVALFINGLSFIASFIVLLSISEETTSSVSAKIDNSQRQTIREAISDLISGIKQGFNYILKNKDLLELLVLSALVNYFLAFYNFLLPFVNAIFLDQKLYSQLLIFGAIGSIVGAFVSKYINNTRFNLLLVLSLSGIGIIAIGIPHILEVPLFVACIGNACFMNFLTIYNIHFISRIQNNVADEYLGRVFSTVFTIAILFMPLGTASISLIANAVNSFSFVVVGMAVSSIAILGMLCKSGKH